MSRQNLERPVLSPYPDDKSIESSFKRVALKYLGYEYAESTRDTVGDTPVFENLSEANVEVVDSRQSGCFYDRVNFSTGDSESSGSRLPVQLNLGTFSVTAARESGHSSSSDIEVTAYTLSRRIVKECTLISPGEPRPSDPIYTRAISGQYVHSCRLTMGYNIIIRVEQAKAQRSMSAPMSTLTLKGRFERFGIQALLEYASRDSQEILANKYTRMTISVEPIGFTPRMVIFSENNFSSEDLVSMDAELIQQIPKLSVRFDTGSLVPKPYIGYPIPKLINNTLEVKPLFSALTSKALEIDKTLKVDIDILKQLAKELEEFRAEELEMNGAEIKSVSSQEDGPPEWFNFLDALTFFQELMVRMPPLAGKKLILVLGACESGKSTLICSLLGIPLDRYQDGYEFFIRVKPGFDQSRPHPEIGSGSIGTTVITGYEDETKKFVIVDCPGFRGPRGPAEDLITLLGLRLWIKQAGGVAKILLVVKGEKLKNREYKHEFVSMPFFLKKILYRPEDAFDKGLLTLVATKPLRDPKIFKEEIKKSIEDWWNRSSPGRAFLELTQVGLRKGAEIVNAGWSRLTEFVSEKKSVSKEKSGEKSETTSDQENINEFFSYFMKNFDKNVVVPDVVDTTRTKAELLPRPSSDNHLRMEDISLNRWDIQLKNFIITIVKHANRRGDQRLKLLQEIEKLESEIEIMQECLKAPPELQGFSHEIEKEEQTKESLRREIEAAENGFVILDPIVGTQNYMEFGLTTFRQEVNAWRQQSLPLEHSMAGEVRFTHLTYRDAWAMGPCFFTGLYNANSSWHVYFKRSGVVEGIVRQVPVGSALYEALNRQAHKDELKWLLYRDHSQLFAGEELWPGIQFLSSCTEKYELDRWDETIYRSFFEFFYAEQSRVLQKKIGHCTKISDCTLDTSETRMGKWVSIIKKEKVENSEKRQTERYLEVKATFLPDWYGYPSNPGLKIFVPCNQHPEIVGLLGYEKREQLSRQKNIKAAQKRISKYQGLVEKNKKKAECEVVQDNKELQNAKKELKTLEDDMRNYGVIYQFVHYILNIPLLPKSFFKKSEFQSIKNFQSLFYSTSKFSSGLDQTSSENKEFNRKEASFDRQWEMLEYVAMAKLGGEGAAILEAQTASLQELFKKDPEFKTLLEASAKEEAVSKEPREKKLCAPLHDQARKYDLELIDVERKGDCLFEAVRHQLQSRLPSQNIPSLQRLRRMACQYIMRNHRDFEGFLVGGDVASFTQKMMKPGTWADGVVIPALAGALNCVFIIVGSDCRNRVIVPRNATRTTPILVLGYEVGIHYQSLLGELSSDLRNLVLAHLGDSAASASSSSGRVGASSASPARLSQMSSLFSSSSSSTESVSSRSPSFR